jgi:hypothetical protein
MDVFFKYLNQAIIFLRLFPIVLVEKPDLLNVFSVPDLS